MQPKINPMRPLETFLSILASPSLVTLYFAKMQSQILKKVSHFGVCQRNDHAESRSKPEIFYFVRKRKQRLCWVNHKSLTRFPFL